MKSKNQNQTPAITKRLGVGLAALVNKKLIPVRVERNLKNEEPVADTKDLSDDSGYYGSEQDEEFGKGFDNDEEVDLTEISEEDA